MPTDEVQSVPRVREGIDITRAGLSMEEGLLVSRVDGKTAVRQLALLIGRPVDVTETMVARLADVGILVLGERSTEAEDPYDGFEFPADAMAEPGPLTPEERKRILFTHHHLSKWSHYKLLDVRWRDDAGKVKDAYFERSKQWHPDRFPRGELGSFRPRIEAIFKAVNEAYRVLKDPARKKAYDTEHAREFDEDDAREALRMRRREENRARRDSERKRRLREANPIRQRKQRSAEYRKQALEFEAKGDDIDALKHAQAAFATDPSDENRALMERFQRLTASQRVAPILKRGRYLESMTQWDEAIVTFREAVRLAPEHGEARLRLAYNMLMGGKSTPSVMEHIQKALLLLPEDPEVHYVRGLCYERADTPKVAVRAFERALELKPDYKEAKKRLSKLRWGF